MCNFCDEDEIGTFDLGDDHTIPVCVEHCARLQRAALKLLPSLDMDTRLAIQNKAAQIQLAEDAEGGA